MQRTRVQTALDLVHNGSGEVWLRRSEHGRGLRFVTSFEGANLFSATRVGPSEYSLVVAADVNNANYTQWSPGEMDRHSINNILWRFALQEGSANRGNKFKDAWTPCFREHRLNCVNDRPRGLGGGCSPVELFRYPSKWSESTS